MPCTSDPDTAGFWEAAGRGALTVLVCTACDDVVHLPRPLCSRCGSQELRWTEVSGRGHLYSYTTVRHQVHPGFPTPYTVILVGLEEYPDVRYTGYVPGAPNLRAGMPMQIVFECINNVRLPNWRIAGSGVDVSQ
jgi:uncharacterized OB-fold protein